MRIPVLRLFRRRHQPERHIGYFALLEALSKPGCAICRREAESARKALEALFYESVNDSRTRERLRRSGGFCKEHARLAAACGDPLGLSIIYRDLVGSYATGDGPDPVALCPVCEACRLSERTTLEIWRAHWDDPVLQQHLLRADLLCRDHFEKVLASLPKGAARRRFRAWAEGKLRVLEEDLTAFIEHSRHASSKKRLTKRQTGAWKAAMVFFCGGVLGETELPQSRPGEDQQAEH